MVDCAVEYLLEGRVKANERVSVGRLPLVQHLQHCLLVRCRSSHQHRRRGPILRQKNSHHEETAYKCDAQRRPAVLAESVRRSRRDTSP
eukprot:3478707-Rhodomonas_salina.1